MAENRSYSLMRDAALAQLAGRDPQEIAAATGIAFDETLSRFRFDGIGGEIVITYPDYDVVPPLPIWYDLALLHYLHFADGIAPGDTFTTLSTLKDGVIRGSDFDRRCDKQFRELIAEGDEARVAAACRSLGGTLTGGNADLNAVFPLFPRCPLMLKLWFPEEELPPSGRIQFLTTADHYLSMEDAVVLGEWLLELLTTALSR